MKVRMLGSNFTPGKKTDVYEGSIQKTVIMMGSKTESITEVPCGNLIAIQGIDKYLTKTGTVTDNYEAHNIRNMKYSVSPVVRVAVQPKNPSDIAKLIQGMIRLDKTDPLVQCINDQETGQNIICCSGELHAEICINDLKELSQIEIIVGDPIVAYKETVSKEGAQSLTKSPNGHNRLYCMAEPLSEEIVKDIDNGVINFKMDVKEKINAFKNHGWDKSEVVKLWAFGPENEGPNTIEDATKACQYMNEIRDSLVTGFNIVTSKGALCEESMRGMRVKVCDVELHADSIHRGGAQLIPASKRVYYASQMKAGPKLMEPFFLVEITCPNEVIGNVYSCLVQKRAEIEEEIIIPNTPMTTLKAYLPVAESFGFNAFLRANTSGKAFPSSSFDHYGVMDYDPLSQDMNPVVKIVKDIRLRKGLKPEITPLSEWEDKL